MTTPYPVTRVVNINHGAAYDVSIDHGYFGNPFFAMENTTGKEREGVIAAYRHDFNTKMKRDPEFKRRILGLKGKTLGCQCTPRACHGDVIVSYLETGVA